MRSLLLLVCFLSMADQLKAGIFDTLKTVRSTDKPLLAIALYNQKIKFLDNDKALGELNQLLDFAIRNGEQELEVVALRQIGIHSFQQVPGAREQGVFYLKRALSRAQAYGLKPYQAELMHGVGFNLTQMEDYAQGFKYMLMADKLMEEVGYQQIPGADWHVYRLAQVYTTFSNHQKAVFYLRKVLELVPPDDSRLITAIYNHMGIVYNEMENNDSALYYYEKALAFLKARGDTSVIGILESNIARIYFKKGNTEQAKVIFENTYNKNKLSPNTNCIKCAWYILIDLASVALKENDTRRARALLDEFVAYAHKEQLNDKGQWKHYYQLMSETNEKEGNCEVAKTYLDSFVVLNESLMAKKNVSVLANLEIQLAAEKQLSDIALLEKENSKQRVIRNASWAISGLLVLLLTGILYGYRMRQRRHIQQQRILLLEKQHAEEQTKHYRQKLKIFIDGVRKKNDLIDQLNNELEGRPPVTSEQALLNPVLMEKLVETIILTEEDWIEFKRTFEKVYPGFISKIQGNYQELTIAEIRLLTLMKLNLSLREMGSMLGISPESVSKHRRNIRVKLGLKHHKEIADLLVEKEATRS